MKVIIAVLYGTDRLDAAELRWPLRLAALHGGDITVLVPATGDKPQVTAVALHEGAENAPPGKELGESLRALLDLELTPSGWGAAAPAGEDAPPRVTLRRVPPEKIAAEVQALVQDVDQDLFVAAIDRLPNEGTAYRTLMQELLRDTHCEVAYVVAGQRHADGELLFHPAREEYARGATRLAVRLAERYQRKATALWVNSPETGSDAERVARRMLDNVLEEELGDEAGQVGRRVEVQDAPERGILAACADERFEAVIIGIKELGVGGFAETRVQVRVARGTDQATVICWRRALPARNRLQRFLDFHLRRIVPQLSREERTTFVESVQSSSEWNFDFIALMALATGIATFGLVGDSSAVIIGAMLVAPLMTPLMGIGLSIVHGNLRLAGTTSRTAFLGFVLVFVLAFCIGSLDREFVMATQEMNARDWPSLVDLSVAFVAGLAAAYASGRPRLLAALPGVAIAASLVPPIATSGLAVSIGAHYLALGAILLFLVNVVAIIVATALLLWLVGLRSRRKLDVRARILAGSVVAAAVLTALALALSPPMSAPPRELIEAIQNAIGSQYRIRHVSLNREPAGRVLQIDLGGWPERNPELDDQLLDMAKKHLGNETSVRLTYRQESLLR